MAAEMFTVGQKDFRLPGLGSYLKESVIMNDTGALIYGLVTLLVIIIALDQFVWRPLLAWSDRFKLEMIESEDAPTSWFYDLLQRSGVPDAASRYVIDPVNYVVDNTFRKISAGAAQPNPARRNRSWLYYGFLAAVGMLALAGAVFAGQLLFKVSLAEWGDIALSLLFTLLRVIVALIIALAWTIPVGVAIGTNQTARQYLSACRSDCSFCTGQRLIPAARAVLYVSAGRA